MPNPPKQLHGRATPTGHSGASYVWLMYLAFLVIDPLMRPSLRIWLLTAAAAAIFVGLYLAYVRLCSSRTRLWLVGGIFLLGVATVPFNQGAATFFIYTVALLPFSLERPARLYTSLLAVIVAYALEGWLTHTFHIQLVANLILISVIGIANISVAQQKRADLRLRLAQEENIALAAVAERERIARDLHDVLGHTLSVIVLKAELAGRLLPIDPARAATELAELEQTARNALAEVREAIGGYRARSLHAELDLARRTLAAAAIALHAPDPTPAALAPAQETVLALALREAVTNIVRHAPAATRCTLRFRTAPGGTTCTIEDDAPTPPALTEGNGLRGMRERAEALGGRLHIETSPHTRLSLELPA